MTTLMKQFWNSTYLAMNETKSESDPLDSDTKLIHVVKFRVTDLLSHDNKFPEISYDI